MQSATTATFSSSRPSSDSNMADAASRTSQLPPPTVLLEASQQHQPNSAWISPGATNLPSSTIAAAQVAQNASAPNQFESDTAGGPSSNDGGVGAIEPVPLAQRTVTLPRMMLPSHCVSQSASTPSAALTSGLGLGQTSALGFVQRHSSTMPNALHQAYPIESVAAAQPSAATAQQFFAYSRSQAGAVHQQPYQQYPQQSRVQPAGPGGQWKQQGCYQQPQPQYSFTAVSGSTLPTSPPLSTTSDKPPMANDGNHVLTSPPAAPSPAGFGSPAPVAQIGNINSAISGSWSQLQQSVSTTTAGPPMMMVAAGADGAAQSPPTLPTTTAADMDHAVAVAAAAMASMISNANAAQQHTMDPQAALPSMMFSSDPSTPPSPMDSLAMAAAAVAAASASASAARSTGNSPPSPGAPIDAPPARPRATRLRPPQPYPYLITIALLNSPRRKLTLREIYTSIQAQYPHLYGPDGPAGDVQKSSQSWKNTVRFNLSRSGLFVRLDEFDRVDVGRAGTGPGRRSAYWTIAPQWLERIQREGPACVMRLGDARKSRSINALLSSTAQAPEGSGAASAAAAVAAEPGGDIEGQGSADESDRSSGGQQNPPQAQHDDSHSQQMHDVQQQQQQPLVPSMPPPPYQPNELPHPAAAFPHAFAYQQQQQQQQQRPHEGIPGMVAGSVWASPTMQPQPYHPQFVTSPTSLTSSITSLAWQPATAPAAAAGRTDWHHHPYQQQASSANASPVTQTATLVAVKHEPGSPYAYAVYQSPPSGQVHQQQAYMAALPPPPPPPPQSVAAQQPMVLSHQHQQPQVEQNPQLRPGEVRWLLN